VHFWLTFIFFNGVMFPMHILGMRGMQRRIYDYTQYTHLQGLQPLNIFMSFSAFALGVSQIILIVNFFWSLKLGERVGDNPWHANTLEWQTTSPPPHENFAEIPIVYHGPYEYSVPGMTEDYLPQTQPASAPLGSH
jgi:cytochrome c oxidase subunit 1